MVAFNFSPEFAEDVASGKKLQTIRQTKRAKVGDKLQLYTGQRTKACRLLRESICEMVDYVGIRPDGLTVGNTEMHLRNIDDFARADGFRDFRHMVMWFEKKYGSPYFTGCVYRWAAAPTPHTGAGR